MWPTCSAIPIDEDRVEGTVDDLPVVLHPDLDAVGQTELLHPRPPVQRLFVADRDTDHIDVVVRGGVDGHRRPTAPHVEQPAPGAGVVCFVEAELSTDQLVLGRLRLLERGAGSRETGTRVGHRRAEDQLVEVVAHVVVVADGGAITPWGVADTRAERSLSGGGCGRLPSAPTVRTPRSSSGADRNNTVRSPRSPTWRARSTSATLPVTSISPATNHGQRRARRATR